MSLPLEDLGSDKRERKLLRRLGLALALLAAGAAGGVGAAAKVWAVEGKIDGHLREMELYRPMMDRYVREERSARCSVARNVYLLCRTADVECEPVSASCENEQ